MKEANKKRLEEKKREAEAAVRYHLIIVYYDVND